MTKEIKDMTIREFVDHKVDEIVQYVEKEGKARVSTCSDRNWCNKTWCGINLIVTKMRERGYGVSLATNYGVQDWDFYLIN
jgi:hypothetical protein